MCKVKNSSNMEIPQYFFIVVVAMVIVISSEINGFGWMDLQVVWFAASTVRLQVSDYSQRSDYNCTEWLVKNKSANAPITFEEIVIVMINSVFAFLEAP